ncbi:MAG: hypothetical protein A2W99_11700 [Bacteroidetes bacterium GWF2_33_16]|nr:MAG: hypothetical protein A2X00_02575 [Bacteroidetes bacterium GWE2_32_14]OFY06363.1 MAG: hypothetical protein A2W99_11700 [Bacteroidetes bacterium GWF2_33_16]
MKTIHIFRIIAAVVLSLSITAIQAQPGHNHHRERHAPNHRYRDLPHWGYKYKVVPKGAFLLRHSGINYHYHSGIYYRPYGDTYVIVRAPIGVRVRTLPNGTVHFVIGGRRYFYYYGTYYVRSVNDDYITVAPPVGAIVDALPDGYKKVIIDNNTYYEFEGTYYKAFIDENGEVLYEVVSSN